MYAIFRVVLTIKSVIGFCFPEANLYIFEIDWSSRFSGASQRKANPAAAGPLRPLRLCGEYERPELRTYLENVFFL